MNAIKNELKNLLIDLKNNNNAIGIKSEFEDEGSSLEEVNILKEIADFCDVNFTIKIGGCGALNDINQAQVLNVDSIVAPMIESSYALEKFTSTAESVYSKYKPNLFINIETINGVNNFDEIINSKEFDKLIGVVVGRFDLAKSIGLECKDCNGDKIFDIVQDIAQKTKNAGKIFTVGGGVNTSSLNFFNKISNHLDYFETRKIIFDANGVIKNNDISAIEKAIKFELLWLNLKQELYGFTSDKDTKRFNILNSRLNSHNLITTK